jgi:putative ABC transport system permease protein
VGLILCTLIVSKQMNHIQNMDLGFDREHVVTLFNNPDLGKRYDTFKQEMLSRPGILHVTSAAQQPMNVGQMVPINWEGNPNNDPILMGYTMIDYDFFKTFDMEIKQGRSFSKQYSTDEIDACIIYESAVERLGLDNPIGTQVFFGHMAIDPSLRSLHVVGVVNNFHYLSMHWESGPFIFRIYKPWHRLVFIKVAGNKIPEALANIKKTFKKYASDYPFRYEFLDAAFNRQYASETQLKRLFNLFSSLAIIVACLGLFGLASFTAEQRTKEIGIRKVLGATTSGIITLTTKDFFKWIAVANLISWPVGYYLMSQWLKSFVYRIHIGLGVFALAAGLTLLITFITIIYQTMKTALANPVNSLRFE